MPGDPLVMKAGSDRPIPVKLLDVSRVFEMQVNSSKPFLQTVVSVGRLLGLKDSFNLDRGSFYS